MRNCFKGFDHDANGEIDKDELKQVIAFNVDFHTKIEYAKAFNNPNCTCITTNVNA